MIEAIAQKIIRGSKRHHYTLDDFESKTDPLTNLQNIVYRARPMFNTIDNISKGNHKKHI